MMKNYLNIHNFKMFLLQLWEIQLEKFFFNFSIYQGLKSFLSCILLKSCFLKIKEILIFLIIN